MNLGINSEYLPHTLRGLLYSLNNHSKPIFLINLGAFLINNKSLLK